MDNGEPQGITVTPELPDYFEETELAASASLVHVDGNLVPQITKMWLNEGINAIQPDASGVQIMAQVRGGQIVGYSACDGARKPLIVAIEHREPPKSQSVQNTCNVMLIDKQGRVLRTYLMPSPE